ncbi:uncharacterized protein LOC143893571 [Temnothorax americanus]|uniref:uncharacterized protein LOC143893571 n=1 Tax=Temnothorax americanus TaxID=1964332 RepID=UPI004067E217
MYGVLTLKRKNLKPHAVPSIFTKRIKASDIRKMLFGETESTVDRNYMELKEDCVTACIQIAEVNVPGTTNIVATEEKLKDSNKTIEVNTRKVIDDTETNGQKDAEDALHNAASKQGTGVLDRPGDNHTNSKISEIMEMHGCADIQILEEIPRVEHEETVSETCISVSCDIPNYAVNSEVRADDAEVVNYTEKIFKVDVGTQKSTGFYSIEMFENDAEDISFYTGLKSYAKFQLLFNTFCPEVHRLRYKSHKIQSISKMNQFLLTLMKLRRNTTEYELSRFFDISKASVSNIFVTWIHFLHQM